MSRSDAGPPAPGEGLAGLEAGQRALVLSRGPEAPLAPLPDAALENLLVVTTSTGPAAIERAVRDRGGDPARVGVVPVSGTDVDYDGPLWTAPRVGPSDLTGISIQASRGLQYVRPGAGWVLVDSVSTLLMYADEPRVFQLVDSLAGAVRRREARGAFTMARDAVGEATYDRFRGLFDVEVDRRRP